MRAIDGQGHLTLRRHRPVAQKPEVRRQALRGGLQPRIGAGALKRRHGDDSQSRENDENDKRLQQREAAGSCPPKNGGR